MIPMRNVLDNSVSVLFAGYGRIDPALLARGWNNKAQPALKLWWNHAPMIIESGSVPLSSLFRINILIKRIPNDAAAW